MRKLSLTAALAALLLGFVTVTPAGAAVSGRDSAWFASLGRECGATFLLNDPVNEATVGGSTVTVTRAHTDMATGGRYCDGSVIGVKIACKNFDTVYESQWEFRFVPPLSVATVTCYGQGFLSEHWIIAGAECFAWTLSGLNGSLSGPRPCV